MFFFIFVFSRSSFLYNIILLMMMLIIIFSNTITRYIVFYQAKKTKQKKIEINYFESRITLIYRFYIFFFVVARCMCENYLYTDYEWLDSFFFLNFYPKSVENFIISLILMKLSIFFY